MIKRIKVSERDTEALKSHEQPVSVDLAGSTFQGYVVNKPWGYEYLMFQSRDIAIWILYIKKGFSTSLHCHPKKKTSLLLMVGEAICSTLNEQFSLKEKEGLIFDKGVFHITESMSPNGIFVMEIETPVDKADLFRLKDNYSRELKSYTDKRNVTNKTYNYHYLYVENQGNDLRVFGKYRIGLNEFEDNRLMLQNFQEIAPEMAVLLSGHITVEKESVSIGDLIPYQDLKKAEFNTLTRFLLLFERKQLTKLSDYVISFLQAKGFDQVFLISGGNLMHLIESVRVSGMKFLCNHHEQASAMAADAYARLLNKASLLMVTSGPGGTNAITGVASAWIDSIPMLVISGQSYSTQTIGNSGLRQLGVQEINIVDMVRPITKYAVMINNPQDIAYELEKALYIANSGRPGPVWIDIPVNIQLADIDRELLNHFTIPAIQTKDSKLVKQVAEAVRILKTAKRPILLVGNGVRLGNALQEFHELLELLAIPVLTSRNGNDLIWDNHPLYVGRPGSFGQRPANLAIQNCDVLLSIGSRIALALTGWAYKDFAREAKKVVVDIDTSELSKPTIKPDIAISADVKEFMKEMIQQLKGYAPNDISEWKKKISQWKEKYPVVLREYESTKGYVNSYYFLHILSELLDENDVIVTDMGMSFQCTMQAFRLKKGQRLFTAAGLAPMGYGLPGAIGACVANNKKRIICISGDGGLQMNLQELQTVVHYKLPIKLFIFNNNGYTSMRETQRAYFKGYIASEPSSGVSMPDSVKIAEAYGIKALRIKSHERMDKLIRETLDYDGAVVCDLVISENQLVIPKQGAFDRPDGKTVPRPIEDMIPYLDREEFNKDMIIEPIPFDPYKDV